MQKNLKTVFLFLFIFSQGVHLFAQDPTYSQFYNNKLYLNPAYIGSTSGLRASFSFREQWSRLPGPLHTYNFAIDKPIILPTSNVGLGIGFLANRDVEGEGALSNNQILLGASVRVPTGKNFFAVVGIMGGLNIQNINWNRLVFADQLDQVLGRLNTPSAAAGLIDETASVQALLNTGFNFWYQNDFTAHTLGFSVNNIFRRQTSLINLDNDLPYRYNTSYMGLIPLGRNSKEVRTGRSLLVSLVPIVLWEHQGGLNTYNAGLLGTFSKNSARTAKVYSFHGGVSYRSQKFVRDLQAVDAVIFHVGLRRFKDDKKHKSANSVQVNYSYDMTLSDLRFNINGSHEINLIFTIGKSKLTCLPVIKNYYQNYLDNSDWYLLY